MSDASSTGTGGNGLLRKLRSLSASAEPTSPSPTPSGTSVVASSSTPVDSRTANAAGMAVRSSPEFVRIRDLPRRTLAVTPVELEALHARLVLPEGTRRLRPIQAAGLLEAERTNGLFGPIGVGAGKSDLALLLPVVMRSKVAVLLVPAALREKVLRQDYPALVPHYRLPRLVGAKVAPLHAEGELHLLSYDALSRESGARILEDLKPDLVICDEAHALRHPSATRTKRFVRYFREHRDTRLCALSGTMTSKSLRDYAHLAFLALREGSPVPTSWTVLEEWAAALDSGFLQAPPGVLVELCQPNEHVREGFRRRLVDTAGVVATTESALGTALNFYERPVEVPKVVRDTLRQVNETWTSPADDEAFDDVLVLHRYLRQLAAGFYYRWVWPNGEPPTLRSQWLDARKAYHREVANFLTHRSKPGIDSPLLYAKAVADGRLTSATSAAWLAVKDLAKPKTEAVWLDSFLVDDAVAWATQSTGIVWYEHAAVGEALAARGLPHYGPGDEGLLKEDGSRSIVASIRAHGTGKNLQAFSRNLVTTPPVSGTTWEQLLGRTHRPGQDADEVEVYVYRHTPEMRGALTKALRDAEYQQRTTGNQQKLLASTFTFEE